MKTFPNEFSFKGEWKDGLNSSCVDSCHCFPNGWLIKISNHNREGYWPHVVVRVFKDRPAELVRKGGEMKDRWDEGLYVEYSITEPETTKYDYYKQMFFADGTLDSRVTKLWEKGLEGVSYLKGGDIEPSSEYKIKALYNSLRDRFILESLRRNEDSKKIVLIGDKDRIIPVELPTKSNIITTSASHQGDCFLVVTKHEFIIVDNILTEKIYDDLDKAIAAYKMPERTMMPSPEHRSVEVTAKVACQVLTENGKHCNTAEEAYDILGCGRSSYGVPKTRYTFDGFPSKDVSILFASKEVDPPRFWIGGC